MPAMRESKRGRQARLALLTVDAGVIISI